MDKTLEKIKSIKKYNKFMKLGVVGILSTTASLIGTITAHNLNYEHVSDLFATSIVVNIGLFLGFAITNGIYNDYKVKKAIKLANKYVNFPTPHLLDDVSHWARDPKNMEAIIKHMLISTYLDTKNFTDVGYILNFGAHSSEITSQRAYILVPFINEAKLSPQFKHLFNQIFNQNFKQDGLLGYCLAYHAPYLFDIMRNALNGENLFTQKDFDYLKNAKRNFYFYRDTEFGRMSYSVETIKNIKNTLDLIYSEAVYPKLPKDVREVILIKTDSSYLEENKAKISKLEEKASLFNPNQTTMLDDIEMRKVEKKAQELKETKKVEDGGKSDNLSTAIESFIQTPNTQLEQIHIEMLQKILEKSKQINQQVDKLYIEEAVEFKNYLEVALPKYLQVFSQSYTDNNYQAQFLSTMQLFDNYLDECLMSIQKTHGEDFLVADTYLQNKLEKYRKNKLEQSEDKNTKKLSINN